MAEERVFAWADPVTVTVFDGRVTQYPNWNSSSPPSFSGKPSKGQYVSNEIANLGEPYVTGLGNPIVGVFGVKFKVVRAFWTIIEDFTLVTVLPDDLSLSDWLLKHFGNDQVFFWHLDLGFQLPAPPIVRPKPVPLPRPPAAAKTMQVSFNTWGEIIPYSMGARRLDGRKIWAKGINAPDQEVTLDAAGTWADSYGYPLVLGEDVYVNRIWFDGTLMWSLASGTVLADQLGSELSFRVYYGTETQTPDADIILDKGVNNTPAFRRQIYIIFFNVPLTVVGNRFPTTSIELLRTDGARINVADALEAVGTLGGINTEVTGVDDKADGVVFYGLSPRDVFAQYRDQYGYRIVDGDPVRLIRRTVGSGLTIDQVLVVDDLTSEANTDDVVSVERADDTSLANQINMTYHDKAIDYQQASLSAQRPHLPVATSTSQVRQSVTTDFIISAAEAKAISFDMLARIWSRRTTLKFAVQPPRGEIEESDILQVPTRQGLFTADVSRRTLLPKYQVEIEADYLLSVRGSNLLADAGSILSDSVNEACYFPETAYWNFRGQESYSGSITRPYMLVDEVDHVWSLVWCEGLNGLARCSTAIPRKISHANIIFFNDVLPGFSATNNNLNVKSLVQDSAYVYVIGQNFATGGTFTWSIIRVNKLDMSVDTMSYPLTTSFPFGQAVLVDHYILQSTFGSSSNHPRMFVADISIFTSAGVTVVDLGVPPTSKQVQPMGAAGDTTRAIFSYTLGNSSANVDNNTWLVSFNVQDNSFTTATLTGTRLSGGVGHGNYGYFLPLSAFVNFDGQFAYSFLGAKIATDLSSTTTFDIRDDPNFIDGNNFTNIPWKDGVNFFFVLNQLSGQNGESVRAPYLASRSLEDLSVATGADLSLFVDAGNYMFGHGGTDDEYHYIGGFLAVDLVSSPDSFVSDDSYMRYSGNASHGGCLLKVRDDLAFATFYALSEASPGNDNFPGYVLSLDTTAHYYNEFATSETNEPNHCSLGGDRSLWWSFTPNTNSWYQIIGVLDTVGSINYGVPHVCAIYSGTTLLNLVSVLDVLSNKVLSDNTIVGSGVDYYAWYNDILKFRTFAGYAAITNRIAADGWQQPAIGNTTFQPGSFYVTSANLSPNDDFANAKTLAVGQQIVRYNNRYCDKEASEPNHAGNAGGKSMWFKFVAPETGDYKILMTRNDYVKQNPNATNVNVGPVTDFQYLLGVYTGSALASLTEIASQQGTATSWEDWTTWATVV